MLDVRFCPTSDQHIRAALIKQLTETNRFKEHTKVIPELTLPNESVRVDVAVVNGVMHGYELKSDIDTLQRLSSQTRAYNAVFDQITLVVGKKHVIHALEIIPEWWGITIAKSVDERENTMLIPVREAGYNPKQDIKVIVNLLWKEEALNCLIELGKGKGFSNKSKQEICEALVDNMSSTSLKAYVRNVLINRRFVRGKQAALSLS